MGETLRVVVGVDLGSTTTKAVLLDEEGLVVGQGITNTRSDYFVACAVARQEALLSARFGQLRSRLKEAFEGEQAEQLDARLQTAFRIELLLDQLASLRGRSEELLGVYPFTAWATVLREPLGRIWSSVTARIDEAGEALLAGSSHFFRDVATEAFMAEAEREAASGRVPMEQLVAVFDRAVLDVELQVPEMRFGELVGRALRRLRRGEGLAEGTAKRLTEAAGAVAALHIEELSAVGTGYGRQRLPFPEEAVRSEILCHGRGAHYVFPGTRTVLDIGGQDTKAIQVDEHGVVTAFQMNDRCAAGCGRYLGYIADELGMGVHELGPLAMEARRQARINSTCTVFAGTELRERLAMGEPLQEVLGGLHRAIMLRAMSLLARSGGVRNELTFTGGVGRNAMCRSLLREMVDEAYGSDITINMHADSIYMGALGAALFALDAVRAGQPVSIDFERQVAGTARQGGTGREGDRRVEPLEVVGSGQGPVRFPKRLRAEAGQELLTAGVDVGSSAVQVVVARCGPYGEEAEVLAAVERRIRRQQAEAVARGAFEEALAQAGLDEEQLAYVASTGEGEAVPFRTGHFYSMTTHGRGALYLLPEAHGVLDVGALHTRAIRIDRRGRVMGQRMTSQCASGSGRFLENIARYLGVPLSDVGRLSSQAERAERISSICAVLAETDVINMVSQGSSAGGILRGIHESIADRLVRLLRGVGVEGPVLVTGGLSRDEGLLAAMERQLAVHRRKGRLSEAVSIETHPAGAWAGALGAALLAARRHSLLRERSAA